LRPFFATSAIQDFDVALLLTQFPITKLLNYQFSVILNAAMTLMDAQQYDPARDRKRRNRIIIVIVLVIILAWAAYHFRNYPERHIVSRFFAALQKQDYSTAYAIWFNDPAWKQHESRYASYQYNDFYRDWGPGGEWGLVKSYTVDCSLGQSGSSGVIVQVTLNERAEHAFVWVQKSDKTMSFSPTEIECGNWWGWITE
jgi:hypothetical protein